MDSARPMDNLTYNNPISMPAFVVSELLSAAETCWADINAVASLADWVGTFHSDGVGEVAGAAIALDLQAWLIDGYYVIRGKARENPK